MLLAGTKGSPSHPGNLLAMRGESEDAGGAQIKVFGQ